MLDPSSRAVCNLLLKRLRRKRRSMNRGLFFHELNRDAAKLTARILGRVDHPPFAVDSKFAELFVCEFQHRRRAMPASATIRQQGSTRLPGMR